MIALLLAVLALPAPADGAAPPNIDLELPPRSKVCAVGVAALPLPMSRRTDDAGGVGTSEGIARLPAPAVAGGGEPREPKPPVTA